MLITTVDELRLHLPNHAYDDLESMAGAFRRSEADVLVEKVGTALYREMLKHYSQIDDAERRDWLVQEGQFDGQDNPWAELTYLCQQVIVFDAFCRNADINAISVNQSGINVVDADNYDAASKDGIAAYKKQLNKEMHAAVNRLLIFLEECSVCCDATTSDNDEPEEEMLAPQQEIVTLWKSSKFYYKHTHLFVATATQFQEYVDIYDSRERFVSLLPDIRFCQRQYIVNELGIPLASDLLAKKITGTGNDAEQETIRMAQEALCLCVETRSKMFNRPEAKDEAFGSVTRMVDYVFWNIESFDTDVAKHFPKYNEAIAAANARKNASTTDCQGRAPKWENNQRGNHLFVTPVIF